MTLKCSLVDAAFCEQASDREFCRLIEHELYHIGGRA
ncbi:putative metallopeptidase [Staphylococcus aureus]